MSICFHEGFRPVPVSWERTVMSASAQQDAKSSDLRRRALARTPGGVHSNVRLTGPTAEFIDRAHGAWLYDVDGHDYVDYLLGQGPNFLGHAPKFVIDAVDAATRKGLILGGQHELEVRASELLCEALGWPDMVRLGMTGTELVQAALRLARAVTGRTKLVRFEGHYHGWMDNILIAEGDDGWGPASSGQIGGQLNDAIVLPWNDADAVEDLLKHQGERIAAVIMEPVMINCGVIEPRPGYLERVRQLCSRHAVVLIFDEVISGFRVGLGGAAERYGVIPDLGVYGKAMGGGYNVSALAGPEHLMRGFGTGDVHHAGTFNGSVSSTAATIATLEYLRDSPPYGAIVQHGTALMDGLRDIGRAHDVPLRVQGLPAAFHVSFGEGEVTDYRSLQRLDLQRYAALASAVIPHGIWIAPRGIWYVSAAHGQSELDATLTRFEAALTAWL